MNLFFDSETFAFKLHFLVEEIIKTKFEGLLIVKLPTHNDKRGLLKELFKQPDNKERNLLDLEILDKDIINTEKDINRRRKTKLLKPKTLKKQRRLLYNSDYSDSSNSSDITNSIESSSSSED